MGRFSFHKHKLLLSLVRISDYAAEYAGGRVVSTPHTNAVPTNRSLSVLDWYTVGEFSKPQCILQKGTLPGECYSFFGTNGTIIIELGDSVVITHVSIEHSSVLLLQDQSTAPKDFEVFVSVTSRFCSSL